MNPATVDEWNFLRSSRHFRYDALPCRALRAISQWSMPAAVGGFQSLTQDQGVTPPKGNDDS